MTLTLTLALSRLVAHGHNNRSCTEMAPDPDRSSPAPSLSAIAHCKPLSESLRDPI